MKKSTEKTIKGLCGNLKRHSTIDFTGEIQLHNAVIINKILGLLIKEFKMD